ncbi:MAG: polyphosphate kinase 2 family protein, partial [Pseudomonadota bacterium]|nr:polyphosphate kinase 2 family protein [Pseudomonadota bacterium]
NSFQQFQVKPGAKVRLRDVDPGFKGKHTDEESAKEETARNAERLRELQELLYAEHQRSLLICLQAMDAGGKDGTIRHALGAMNPQGCKVYSFKKPVGVELDHDFMWRAYRDVPAKGDVAIFNRSHYEDVLAARVHKLVPTDVIERRYGEINAIEKHLSENGTHILKFFLHISKNEQLKRFKDRLDDPTKHWKISESDYTERARWDDYQEAFEIMLSRCSAAEAPWFVIPADHKWFRNLAVSQILVEYLEGLKMQFPKPAVDIDTIRKQYHQAKKA